MNFIKYLWSRLGMPVAWIFLMALLAFVDMVKGITILGSFWVAICLISYFLSRIAATIEGKQ